MMATRTADLELAGFHRVRLRRSGVGHFQAQGLLNGHHVDILVDTGAASTVVSLALCRHLGLPTRELSMRGGGAGGAGLPIYMIDGGQLAIDGVDTVATTLYAVDLVHVNASLAQRGQPPVDVILGADVLSSRAAVIDYGSDSLFLRELAA